MSALHPNLKISTMTQISQISSEIQLSELYQQLEPSDKIHYIEYADYPAKGSRAKPKKQSKGGPGKPTKRKKYFYNQVTIHLKHQKIINMKLFNNGGIQMTGLKTLTQGSEAVNLLLEILSHLPECDKQSIFPTDPNPSIVTEKTKMVMINSGFSMGFKLNREALHRKVLDKGYYSSYEASIYPGVNLKYYYNPSKQQCGVCNCEEICDGRGKNGCCKKITIAAFNSGQVIITGASDIQQLNTSHKFITDFVSQNRESIEEKSIS